MVKMFKLRYLALFTLMIVISCTSKKQEEKEIVFVPDSATIGKEISIGNYDISFKPPINYENLEIYLDKFSEQSAENQNVLFVCGNLEKKSMCFVSNYFYQENVNDSIFLKEFVSNTEKKDFKFGTFKHNGIKFNQLRINENNNIMYSLWFNHDKNNYIKFDYILNQPIDPKDIKAIESSISTIKKQKQGE